MDKKIRILVTGERDEASADFPSKTSDGRALEWTSLPVLKFERLPVDANFVQELVSKPVDWILFTSPRAVTFWCEVCLENGIDFPLETQVGCIGESTADAAARDGFSPDFYPTEPGTEKFLEEFADLLSNNSVKPTIFIPAAEGGRPTLRERLTELGCKVIAIPLYRTLPREDLGKALPKADLEKFDVILFTSPSSFDAFTSAFSLPVGAKVAAIGQYTASHLKARGVAGNRCLPEGDFDRIGEVLC